MKSAEIRRLFIDYFVKNSHTEVASGSLVPAGDATLLFTNAGMVQFKDVFLGRDKRNYTRAVSSQCCIRAGGKHNDLENVGYTARHHTFFEMLGNFSFGDYFKREAIHFAWNFLTKKKVDGGLELPPEKLWVTFYKEDQEAESIWLNEIHIPREKLIPLGEKSNFWSMGDTGPCGPCTEIFYDHDFDGSLGIFGDPPGGPNEDGDRYIEIWNLVFMQYNRTADGQMHPLPKPSVDTGMGLERLSAVMQGVHNNYETDLFMPIIDFAKKLVATTRENSSAQAAQGGSSDNFDINRFRILADHIRSSAFLIAEGVYPSNEGRGYVLRRIIRRALRHGYKCELQSPFFYQLLQPLINIMGEAYPVLVKQRAIIEKVLRQEEEQFAKTLANGLALLENNLNQIEDLNIPGELVFKLYDTYGFPVDLTADIAREKGLTLDIAGFEVAMQRQREMSQKASTFKVDYNESEKFEESSEFHGYEHLELSGNIQKIIEKSKDNKDEKVSKVVGIILDKTPFYAESGGQVGDTGAFYLHNNDKQHEPIFFVQDTQKIGDAIVHYGVFNHHLLLKEGDVVIAKVDAEKRKSTRAHHSVTHLLHSALQNVLGEHVEQKGSIVTAEKTRFDFSHTEALTAEQISQVENWVNERVLLNVPIHTDILPFEEAKQSGAMALFGEKYGDTVRVLSMGDFSKELCGGTHAGRTGDIGLFKIISENGISAGVRRIEGLAGMAALHWIQQQEQLKQQACQMLFTNVEQLPGKIEQLLENQRNTQKILEQLQNQLAAHASDDLLKQVKMIAGVNILISVLKDAEAKNLRTMMDALRDKLNHSVIILVSINTNNDAMQVIASVSKECVNKKLPNAKALVQWIAEKGGGRDDLAQGGAKKPADLMQRLDSIHEKLAQALMETA